MVKDSVLTGIETLDKLIGGGFEPGSLILVAGRPGTGKTSFATQFVCKGVEEGEVGVYVSFAEDKSTLICNMEKTLGYGCEEYVKSGKLKILDMIVTRKESVSAILDLILSEASEAKRLVIDSFSAMVQAFKDPVESRIILHAILSRMVRQFRCTTLLICEVPVGEERIGFGIEEFVADGVILLRMNELEGHIFRDLEIKKLRGRQLLENKIVLTLNGGRIKAFQPFSPKPIEKQAKFNPIKDPPEKFSTGNPDLDRLLEGGYPRGGTVVFEVSEKITTSQYSLLISPTAWNFVVNNRWVLIIPSIGVNY
ncbi:MAG: ATPase domain-containing protein [Candidatus Bathyarchaeota archaeon]